MADKKLKVIPGISQGVRENAAQRMMKLARPICPNSQAEYETLPSGKTVKKDKGPGKENCQLLGHGWWDTCAILGHNPYFTERTWYTKEDRLEEQEVNGQAVVVKVGEYLVPHHDYFPNLAQVAISIRINNGRGASDAIEKKGFKRLPEIGYEEVCQFRNCQKPVSPSGISRKYGAYCSKRHLQLIAADAQSIMLTQGAIAPADGMRAAQNRENQLNSVPTE